VGVYDGDVEDGKDARTTGWGHDLACGRLPWPFNSSN
jgi:hypothetical protein